jgi:DNA-binding transcriptional regulator YiaG
MANFFKKLSPEEIKNIRTVSKLKFAQDFAPTVYDGYLTGDEKDLISVNRLPADGDTIMTRLLKIREREYMYVDTLNEYYQEYYAKMWSSYENWRKLNYEEIKAIRKIESNALKQKLLGALLVAGAIALNAGEVKNTGALQVGMILIGGQVIVNGFNVTKEAEIHSAAIKELSESFGSEMQPIVMEFEGKQYELTGSAEEQFKHWRELLRQIYITETGFDSDISSEDKEKTTSEDSE